MKSRGAGGGRKMGWWKARQARKANDEFYAHGFKKDPCNQLRGDNEWRRDAWLCIWLI
jgi:hypothetical protein